MSHVKYNVHMNSRAKRMLKRIDAESRAIFLTDNKLKTAYKWNDMVVKYPVYWFCFFRTQMQSIFPLEITQWHSCLI